MLFEKRLQSGLVDGSIRVAFRRWRRPQVVSGRDYRSPIGLIRVDSVSSVDGDISVEDVTSAGFTSVEELCNDLNSGPSDGQLYRLELRRLDGGDPREQLASNGQLTSEDIKQIRRKLERLDQHRAWTLATLRAIQANPGVRAGDLAPALGWDELHDFKMHVRKLKELGLTISLRVGYRLSPRGEAFINAERGA